MAWILNRSIVLVAFLMQGIYMLGQIGLMISMVKDVGYCLSVTPLTDVMELLPMKL
jgi:hypothetical protein